jgi:hypothetical protein
MWLVSRLRVGQAYTRVHVHPSSRSPGLVGQKSVLFHDAVLLADVTGSWRLR